MIVAQQIGDALSDLEWVLARTSLSDHGDIRKRLDPEWDLFPTELLNDPLTTEKLDQARFNYREFLFVAAKKWAKQFGNGAPSIGNWALLPVYQPDARTASRSFHIDLVVDVFVSEDRTPHTLWLGEDRRSCASTELIAMGRTAKQTVAQAMTERPLHQRDLIRWLGREEPLS